VTNIEPPEHDQRPEEMMQRKSELITSQISLIEQQIDALNIENYSLLTTVLRLEGQSQKKDRKRRM